MAISKANKALSTFFEAKDEAEITNVFKEAQESIRSKLNLPPEFKLSGLTFETIPLGLDAECNKICRKWIPKNGNIPGHWKIYCC